MRKIVFLCGVVGALLFVIASIMGGLQIQGYSFISQYISESYATGIPNSDYLRYMFIASGFLLFLFGLFAHSTLPKSKGIKIVFILFGVSYGLGTVLTGYFPCDLGCRPDPINPSLSQFIHNTAGFLTYSTVPFFLIGLGISFKKLQATRRLGGVSLVCGILALVFVAFLFGNPTGPYIGLFQRIIEASILSWIIYCSFHIWRTGKE